MNLKLLFFVLLVGLGLNAQTTGTVRDSLTGKPIPYVSIWVENENIGTTSEENGFFEINTTAESKRLIFSSLGFRTKKMAIAQAKTVYLSAEAYKLKEVVVQKRKETKRREIGKTGSAIMEAFDNGPRIAVKFFPYASDYKKTKFIKKVVITTDSKMDDASFKIHFYSVDENGYPGAELIKQHFIATVSRGNKQTYFDLTKFALLMPKTGIFVGFEKLMIEENKGEKTYYPLVLYNWVARDFAFTFTGGKWSKQLPDQSAATPGKLMTYEPAINLILTN